MLKSLLTSYILAVMIAVSVFPMAKIQAAVQPPLEPFKGRLVKSATDSAVYYVGTDGKRHAFPNAKIFFSWYDNFSSVEIVDSLEMALLPLGRNVMYRPGTRLVKITDVSEVYAVEPGGVLRNIPSEEAAGALYGPRWADLVDDLDISFFFDYEIGGVIDVVDGQPLYPRGTAVNFQGESFVADKTADGVFWLRPFRGEAWAQNGFDRVNRYTLADASVREFYEIGLPVALPETSYACPACDPSSSVLLANGSRKHTSENGRYSISTPADWGASFTAPDLDMPSEIFLAVESITDDSPWLSIYRYPRIEGDTLAQFTEQIVDDNISRGSRLYASGTSAIRFDQKEISMTRFDGFGRVRFIWSSLKETPEAFYVVSFDADLEQLPRLREMIDQAFRSLSINESVLE